MIDNLLEQVGHNKKTDFILKNGKEDILFQNSSEKIKVSLSFVVIKKPTSPGIQMEINSNVSPSSMRFPDK